MKGEATSHSAVTRKGQTTIPSKIRDMLQIKPGDRLEYQVEGDHVILRVHPGTKALQGSLTSNRGRGLSFAQIRAAAAKKRRARVE